MSNTNKLQSTYKWLPEVNGTRKYENPFSKDGKLSLFNYDQKLKDLIGDMVIYMTINNMVKKGIFSRNSEEKCKEIYSEIISEATYKVMRGLGNWNIHYDIALFVNLNVSFAFTTYFYNEKNRQNITTFSELSEEHVNYIENCIEKEEYDQKMYDLLEDMKIPEPEESCTSDYTKPIIKKKRKCNEKIKNHMDCRTEKIKYKS